MAARAAAKVLRPVVRAVESVSPKVLKQFEITNQKFVEQLEKAKTLYNKSQEVTPILAYTPTFSPVAFSPNIKNWSKYGTQLLRNNPELRKPVPVYPKSTFINVGKPYENLMNLQNQPKLMGGKKTRKQRRKSKKTRKIRKH